MILETKKLDDVCDVVRGGSPRPIKKYITTSSDGLNWIKISDATASDKYIFKTKQKIKKEGALRSRIVKKGDLILSNSMSFGRPYIMKTTGCVHDGWLVLSNYQSKLNVEYFYYLLSSPYIIQQFEKVATGSTVRNLNISLVKNIQISFPSLEEQQHIVGKLDAVFAEINNKEQLNLEKLNNINKFKKSILDNLLGNNLIKLNEACDLIKRGISPKYLETGGVAVINQKCIRNHIIDYSKARRHDIDLKKVPEERFIKKGDVLINSTGHGTLGRVAQVNQKPAEKTTVDSHVTIIRPKQELFDLGYFANALIKIEKQLEEAAEGASGQTELSRSKLENEFSIPYMDSIDKQRKVSLIINSIFENIYILKNLTGKIIENLKSLKLSFLYKELHNKKI